MHRLICVHIYLLIMAVEHNYAAVWLPKAWLLCVRELHVLAHWRGLMHCPMDLNMKNHIQDTLWVLQAYLLAFGFCDLVLRG